MVKEILVNDVMQYMRVTSVPGYSLSCGRASSRFPAVLRAGSRLSRFPTGVE